MELIKVEKHFRGEVGNNSTHIINVDFLTSISECKDWFFEQNGKWATVTLGAYSIEITEDSYNKLVEELKHHY